MIQKTFVFITAISRFAVVFSGLLWMQHSGVIDGFLERSPGLRVDTAQDFYSAVFLICLGRLAVTQGISKLWNHITPIRDRTTFIEGEIVDAASFSAGAAVFILVFLGQGVLVSLQAGALVGIAALPALALGWAIQHVRARIWPVGEAVKVANYEHVEAEIVRNAQGFWRSHFAYFIAAVVFNVCVVGIIAAIVFLKTGGGAGVSAIAFSCTVATFVTLVIFGKIIVGLGHKCLSILRVPVLSERLRHTLAYALGYLVILSVFVALCLWGQHATNPAALFPWWAYAVAYGVIAISAVLAGLCFARFYTPISEPPGV